MGKTKIVIHLDGELEEHAEVVSLLIRDALADFLRSRHSLDLDGAAEYVAVRYPDIVGTPRFEKKVEEVRGRLDIARRMRLIEHIEIVPNGDGEEALA